MEHIKHCAVLIRRSEDIWEGTRTALGLAAHNFWVYLYVIGVEVEMTDVLKDNLEWLEEMECGYFSDHEGNLKHGFKYIPLEKIAGELKKMDLVIPFANRNDRSSMKKGGHHAG